MEKTVRIGIDFGTTYSFAGFEHGDFVMPLIPAKERYGIPSIFYYDGTSKLVGRMAERRAEKKPEHAVRSIKRNLEQECFQVGGKEFSAREVVTEILSYIIECAENQLTNIYLEQYDNIEAVITVPVDFSEPEVYLIREAASAVTLSNGKKLQITGVIREPVAAAIEYFGLKKEKDANILVYDLGGGTFDVALVRAHADGTIPYEVIDQEGDRRLGGDDWDRALADWIGKKYQEEFGKFPSAETKEMFVREARRFKEELTELNSISEDIPMKGDYLTIDITREEFDRITKPLLDRTVDKVKKLLKRRENEKIDHVILTGGSSYMPQVRAMLSDGTLFGKNMDILFVEPEHAIAYGAARYAATRRMSRDTKDVIVEEKIIDLKATHSYGIVYTNYETHEDKLGLFIHKGDKVPVSVTKTSMTGYEDQFEVAFKVFESDYDGTDTYIAPSLGHKIMEVTLKRTDTHVPKGTESTDTMTLTEEGMLTFESKDTIRGLEVKNEISIKRMI